VTDVMFLNVFEYEILTCYVPYFCALSSMAYFYLDYILSSNHPIPYRELLCLFDEKTDILYYILNIISAILIH